MISMGTLKSALEIQAITLLSFATCESGQLDLTKEPRRTSEISRICSDSPSQDAPGVFKKSQHGSREQKRAKQAPCDRLLFPACSRLARITGSISLS